MDLSKIIVPEGLELKPVMTTCTIEGVLDEEDLRQLVVEPGDVTPAADDPSDLSKIREKHHHVARLVAGGMQQRLVANITGYTESYISILLNNPSMKELVELYRIQHGAAVQLATEKLKTVGLKALEKLDEKLDKDELNNQEILAAAKLGLDRSGHGPQSKHSVVEEHHVIDHAQLKALNEEARRRNADYIVPQDQVRTALEPPVEDAEHCDFPDSDNEAVTGEPE